MIDSNRADERMQRWTEALRRKMGMPTGGTGTDATRWFALSDPGEQIEVKLGKLAIESRVDIVLSVFRHKEDREPSTFGVVFRTLKGVWVAAGIPVVVGKDEPVLLYSPESQCLFSLDERGILAKRCGERVSGLQLAHKRAMKRLRKAAATIDVNALGGRWQALGSEASIPLSKISKLTVRAA